MRATPMPVTERSFKPPPTVRPGGGVIVSPFQVYTTGEDNLRILSANSLAGVSLKIGARLITPFGEISASQWDHTPNTDRSTKAQDFNLPAGAIGNLTVFANAGAPAIGQTFVIVQLVRGLGAAAIVLATLLQGYVTGAQGLGWPGSPIQSSTDGLPPVSTQPGQIVAPGNDFRVDVPNRARWQVSQVQAVLSTDATVGNRTVGLKQLTGGNFDWFVLPSIVQAPSTVVRYTWASNLPYPVLARTDVSQSPMPADVVLVFPSQIFSAVLSMGPADNFLEVFVSVREWLEVTT